MAYDRAEIEAAFQAYRDAAAHAGRTGDWRPWVECFTEDCRYVEHLYGTFHGREAVLEWITATMRDFPFDHMTDYPWNWYSIDADNGWVIGEVANNFDDPGDGVVYGAANWTRLLYAGDGLFSEEEDVYNPAEFEPMVKAWLTAWKAHHP